MASPRGDFYQDFFNHFPSNIYLTDEQIEAAVLYWFRILKSDSYSVNPAENNGRNGTFRANIAAQNKKTFFEKLNIQQPTWEKDFKEGLKRYLQAHRRNFLILGTDYAAEDSLAEALQASVPALLEDNIFPHKLSMTFGATNNLFINNQDTPVADILASVGNNRPQPSVAQRFFKALGCPRAIPALEKIHKLLGM